jgi:predicted esterase
MAAGCGTEGVDDPGTVEGPRLAARPGEPSATGPVGASPFAVPGSSAVIYVPFYLTQDEAAPLVVFLHGGGRTVDAFVERHRNAADNARAIVLAPYAGAGTWDALQGLGFTRDPSVLDAALRWTFERWRIEPSRIALSGFSDGGTYSLAIGRANGDLFARVVAYAPGSLLDVPEVQRPPILIAHGTADVIFPVDQTSRLIVPRLRDAGYTVDYREFDGPHAVPDNILHEVVSSIAA